MKHSESKKAAAIQNLLPPRPMKGLLLVIFLIILLLLTGFWLRRDNGKKVSTYKASCSDELLVQGKINLEPPQPAELAKVTQEIQKLSGYQNDPNCLYLVIANNLQVSDSESARNNFNKLKDNYQTEKLSPILFTEGKQDQLLQNLDQQITDLNAINEANKHQVIMSVEGPESP